MEYTQNLKAWLRFNDSTTADVCGNSWAATGNPSISSQNAKNGKALQLDGSSHITLSGLPLCGQAFTIDLWVYANSSTPSNGRVISIINPATGNMLFSLRRRSTTLSNSAQLEIYSATNKDAAQDNGSVTTLGVNTTLNNLIHFALVYTGSDNTARVYINGARAFINTAVHSRLNCDIVVGALSDNTQGLIGTIDELRIYDGVQLYNNSFTPPSASEYDGFAFYFDTQRKVINPLLTWFYKNPGRADLLTTATGTTVTGLTADQSITGVGFYQPDRTACFGISATKEIWIRCDAYTTENYANNNRLRIYSDDSNGTNGWATNATITNKGAIWHNSTSQTSTNVDYLGKNKNRSILLHMKSGSSDGLIEISLKNLTTGNEYTDTYTGNVNAGNDFANVYIQMDGSNIYVSNLVISNVELTFETSYIYPVFDAIRMPKIPATLWRYENAGTTSDLINTNTAVQVNNLPQTQSKTGSAFYQTTENIALFDIATNTPEIWIKFDVYSQSYGWYVWDCTNYTVDGSNTGVMVFYQNTSETVVRVFKSNNNFDDVSIDCIDGQLRTFVLHMKADSTDGIIELYSDNGGLIYEYTGSVNYGTAFSKIDFISEPDEKGVDLFSNVVISNNPLWFYDNVSADISVSFSADAQREILKSLLLSIDAEREIVGGAIQQSFYADVQRVLAINTSFLADIERGIQINLSLDCDVERLLENAVTIHFDAQRNVVDEEIWRYENVGLLYDLQNLPGAKSEKAEFHNVPTEKSTTGVAFYQCRSGKALFPIPSTNRIWVKFDIYQPATEPGISATWGLEDSYSGAISTAVSINYADHDNLRIWNPSLVVDVQGQARWGTIVIDELDDVAKVAELQTYIVHLEADNSDGIIEVFTDDGGLIYSYYGQVHVGQPFSNITLSTPTTIAENRALFSNIVISNGKLDFDDNAQWPDLPVTFDCDIIREIDKSIGCEFDTSRLLFSDSHTVDYLVDLSREVDYNAETVTAMFDTERALMATINIGADVVRKLAHNVVVPVYVPPEYDPPSHDTPVFPRPEDNSIIQSCTISMREQQLTDDISFVYAGSIGIMAAVNLTYMDYVINGRVEETVTKGVLESCQLASDVDELLYQQLAYEIPSGDYEWSDEYNAMVLEYNNANPDKQAEKVPSASASTHIQTIASKLGKNVALHFADFISTMSTKAESGTTYASLISELFGWTSRIPQMMINVYMRGNTIYVVQRGYEPSTVTLDNANIANVTIKRKIMRTTWGSSPWSKEEVTPFYGSDRSVDYVPYNPNDDSGEGGSGTAYNDEGLVEETVVQHGDETVTTKYEYIEAGNGQKFLYREIQETSVSGEGVVDKIETIHKPVSSGQTQVYSVDDDGVIGSVVTPSTFDDRITPWQQQSGVFSGGGGGEYSPGASGLGVYDDDGRFHEFAYDAEGNRYIKKVSYTRTQTGNDSRTIFGVPLVDTSFPVDGNDKLTELTNAIAWLNRKTEESISFELYNYPHVIDFSDKIVVGGNTYFLRSNTATTTETIVNKQTLEIVRWY